MTRMIHGAGAGVTHGAGDGLSEFPSDLADAGTAGSAAALSVQASDASALPMRVLVEVSAAAVADSMINMAGPTGRSAAEDMVELSLTRAPLLHGSDAEPNDGIPPVPTFAMSYTKVRNGGMKSRPIERIASGFLANTDAGTRASVRAASPGSAGPCRILHTAPIKYL